MNLWWHYQALLCLKIATRPTQQHRFSQQSEFGGGTIGSSTNKRQEFSGNCLKTVIIYDSSSTEITSFAFYEADNSKLLKLLKNPLAQISVHKQSPSGTVLVALKA